MGFGSACAPVRCAHPSFWAHYQAQQGAARPPHRSFAAPPKIKNKLFPETKCFASGPNSGRQGHIFFHWTTEASKYNIPRPSPHLSHPSKLRCTQLSLVFTVSYYIPRPQPRPSQNRWSSQIIWKKPAKNHSMRVYPSTGLHGYEILCPPPFHRSFADPYGEINDM